MRFSSLGGLALAGASICAALPTDYADFLLVTTPQSVATADTSEQRAISATSLFDPFNQPNFLLRLIGPGYGSLPKFTLTDGTLSTTALAPFTYAPTLYNSTQVEAGQELQFLSSVQPTGNLALDAQFLLTVDGEREGWTICDGKMDEDVLSWKGTANDCVAVYVHAVSKAPY